MALDGTKSTSDTLITSSVDASIDVTKIEPTPTAITPGLTVHKEAASDLKSAAKAPTPEPVSQEASARSSCGKCTIL